MKKTLKKLKAINKEIKTLAAEIKEMEAWDNKQKIDFDNIEAEKKKLAKKKELKWMLLNKLGADIEREIEKLAKDEYATAV